MTQEKYELLKHCLDIHKWEIDFENGTVSGKRGTAHSKTNQGYYQFATTVNGKTYVFPVHQIIMVAAGYNLVDMTVNHKNGIKTDNRLENLEAVTAAENIAHAWATGLATAEQKPRGEQHAMHKLTDEAVRDIKKHLALKDCTQRSLAEKYGVYETQISDIKHGRTWKHIQVNHD